MSAADVVDEWLESRVARWERGLELMGKGRGLALLEDCPPIPGDVSYADLFAEMLSRMTKEIPHVKRFLLFAGEYYYPDAGVDGIRGNFDSLHEAEMAGHVFVKAHGSDWFNVLDTQTGERHTAGMDL